MMSSSFAELLGRIRDRFRRATLERELEEELGFHRSMLERDYAAAGAAPDEARRRASLQLGNATYLKEETRAAWSFGWFDDLMQDVRYGVRALRRNPAFASAVVLTLALGIGANTAIFSIVNAVVLRSLPYANPDELYSISTFPARSPADRNPASFPDLADWRKQNSMFSEIGGYAFNRFEMTSGDVTDLPRGIIATAQVYEVLGAAPLVGRLPRADEERAPVMAISYRLWQERFGGSRDVVGRRVLLYETPYTIIGVMPAGFHFPSPDIDLWLTLAPFATSAPAGGANPWFTSRGLHGWRTVARLLPGVTPVQAERQMTAIMERLGEAYPSEDGGTGIALQSIRNDTVGGVQRGLWLALGAAGLVLLLACANVAHLMLARMSSRSREIAIRRALGAGRSRVARQLLTESVLLGVVGGVIGLAFAAIAIRVLIRLSPGDIPRLENVSLDAATLAFAIGVSVLTGVLFGAGPAFVAWRGASGWGTPLRAHARGAIGAYGSRARSVLTTAEVAFAMILLVGAGLMVRTLGSLLTAELGFQTDNVVAFHVAFPSERYPGMRDKQVILDRVLERLRAIPGVALAGGSTSLPPSRMQQATGYQIEHEPPPRPGQEPQTIFVPASPQFLSAIGVPLLSGRGIDAGDGSAAPRVAVISRELARRSFGARSPIGHRLELQDSMWTIVGVVGDVSFQGVDKAPQATVYVPWAQSPFGGVWIAVRSKLPANAIAQATRVALHEIDPSMNARDLKPMDEFVGDSMIRPRFQTWLLTTFGGLALLLAAIGIYGVIAYGVAQRTAEIGLRLALGAPPESVVASILRRGMAPVGVGLALGAVGSLGVSRLMSGFLYGVSPGDGATLAATAVLLGGVALFAAFLPARRAAKLDPLLALRQG
jgi:putative ABC transport system permease protein